MIKILITSVLFLLWFNSNAQFIDESKQWNVRQELNFGPVNTAIYKLQGDTVMNGHLFERVWVNQDSTTTFWYNTGFLREESNRVYYLQYEQEGLLYDFNLNPGDTTYVISINCWEPQEKIVFNVDTIDLFGIWHKRWVFDEMNWDIWIEGIGSLYGPLNSIYPCYTDFYVDLLCYYENDSLRYMHNWYDGCYITSVGLEEDALKSSLMISPNPSTEGSPIKISSDHIISDLEILEINGSGLKHYQNLNSRYFIIDPVYLHSGVYLVKVLDETRQIKVYKIVRF